jgi:hypothetical protein
MKKLLVIVLILTVCILLVSCSADSSEKDTEYNLVQHQVQRGVRRQSPHLGD